MLNKSDLHEYQQKAVVFQCSSPHSMLWLDMGLGKTSITLTSIAHLLETGFLKKVLIVAPIRVVRLVWRQEAVKWSNTKHLRFSVISGTRDQRTRALLKDADVYLMNYENLKWLSEVLYLYFASKGRPLPFDGLVWDEISKMKNSSTVRVSAFKTIYEHFKWVTGLTGTPASNGYKDLHGQYLVVDGGKRLGEKKTPFLKRFYRTVDDRRRKTEAYKDSEEIIKRLIGDITLEMSASDYNPLPDLVVNDVYLEFDKELREKYETLEEEFFITLDSGANVEIFNKAALSNKCLQFSNGSVYLTPGSPLWESVHELKLDALEDIVDEAQGSPILCSYAYKMDAERIMKRFAYLDPINLTECKSEKSLNEAMAKWATGECALMIGHPASMAHGIDGLQKKGHIIVWFGLNWSLDFYHQLNGRLRRQGQGVPVIAHRILIKDTLDVAQSLALLDKEETEHSLRNAVKLYRKSKYGH